MPRSHHAPASAVASDADVSARQQRPSWQVSGLERLRERRGQRLGLFRCPPREARCCFSLPTGLDRDRYRAVVGLSRVPTLSSSGSRGRAAGWGGLRTAEGGRGGLAVGSRPASVTVVARPVANKPVLSSGRAASPVPDYIRAAARVAMRCLPVYALLLLVALAAASSEDVSSSAPCEYFAHASRDGSNRTTTCNGLL